MTQQHERFRRELIRARDAGIRIIVLCEHGEGIESLADVYFWQNPRLFKRRWIVEDGKPKQVPAYPKAKTGAQLVRTLETISERYGVRFEFCNPAETGETIVRLLGGEPGG